MSNTTAIAGNKYVSMTTFTKDGTAKPLPVWIVELADGRVGFTTSPDSWKVKRIAHTPKVTLQACDMRGRIEDGANEVTGSAVLGTPDDVRQIQALVKKKYGFGVTFVKVMNAVRGLFSKDETQSVGAVVITLDQS